MPPFTIIDREVATSTDGAQSVAVRTPRRARLGMALYAFACWPSTHELELPQGWLTIATFSEEGAIGSAALLARPVMSQEVISTIFAFTTEAEDWDDLPPPVVAILAVRGGNVTLAASDDGIATSEDGFTLQVPNVVAGSFSDAVLVASYVAGEVEIDLPETLTEILSLVATDSDDDEVEHTGTFNLSVRLPEAAGPIGVHVIGVGGPNTAGICAAVAAPAEVPISIPRIEVDAQGAIGLTTVGV
ncbi:MAG: hypothetical protein AB7O24_01165 [Kofleriaceae bacterium]